MTACGGSLARDLVQEHEPELLITDIRMPKISGLDLACMIDENKYPTKIIIISGHSDFSYAKQALRYGVSEYLVKPVLKEEFTETLERILGCMEKNGALPEGERGKCVCGDKKAVIECVKSYIQENFQGNLSLETIGEVVHLHPAYLSKIFKEATGTKLSCYIADIRMEKAAELLDRTNLKVHEVVEQVGYQKSQHFSKLFKERYGLCPNEYRKCIR